HPGNLTVTRFQCNGVIVENARDAGLVHMIPGSGAERSQLEWRKERSRNAQLVQHHVPVRIVLRFTDSLNSLWGNGLRPGASGGRSSATANPVEVRAKPGKALALDRIELLPDGGHLVFDRGGLIVLLLALEQETVVLHQQVGIVEVCLIKDWPDRVHRFSS